MIGFGGLGGLIFGFRCGGMLVLGSRGSGVQFIGFCV